MLLKWITLKKLNSIEKCLEQDGGVLIDEKSAEYYANKAIYIECSRYYNILNILSVLFLRILICIILNFLQVWPNCNNFCSGYLILFTNF